MAGLALVIAVDDIALVVAAGEMALIFAEYEVALVVVVAEMALVAAVYEMTLVAAVDAVVPDVLYDDRCCSRCKIVVTKYHLLQFGIRHLAPANLPQFHILFCWPRV